MVRVFGSTILLAVGIAVVLSYLPTVQMGSSGGEVSVFQRQNPTVLTERRLADFLTLNKTAFSYTHATWDDDKRVLDVDFSTSGHPAKEQIAETWLPFIERVFEQTSNVETLTCRLYRHAEVIASVKADRDRFAASATGNSSRRMNAAERLEHFFIFHAE